MVPETGASPAVVLPLKMFTVVSRRRGCHDDAMWPLVRLPARGDAIALPHLPPLAVRSHVGPQASAGLLPSRTLSNQGGELLLFRCRFACASI